MSTQPSTTDISSWERATKHVEASIRTGRYINAETSLLYVGPPRLGDVGGINTAWNNLGNQNNVQATDPLRTGSPGSALYPVGLVEAFSLQQSQMVAKMFEIGSRRSYQAGGRVQVAGSIGRVMFNGPSLMRVLYAYYPGIIQQANGKLLIEDSVSGSKLQGEQREYPSIYLEAGAFASARGNDGPPHSFFINLMSELFSHPFGMGVLFRDNKNDNYGAFYCEDCMINSHSLVISSSSTLITEAVNFQCDAAIPMEFATAGDEFQIAPLSA